MSPPRLQSLIASATSATGLTVGCDCGARNVGAVVVNQNWNDETEGRDAVGNLTDLLA